jgi:hypothetical protein
LLCFNRLLALSPHLIISYISQNNQDRQPAQKNSSKQPASRCFSPPISFIRDETYKTGFHPSLFKSVGSPDPEDGLEVCVALTLAVEPVFPNQHPFLIREKKKESFLRDAFDLCCPVH